MVSSPCRTVLLHSTSSRGQVFGSGSRPPAEQACRRRPLRLAGVVGGSARPAADVVEGRGAALLIEQWAQVGVVAAIPGPVEDRSRDLLRGLCGGGVVEVLLPDQGQQRRVHPSQLQPDGEPRADRGGRGWGRPRCGRSGERRRIGRGRSGEGRGIRRGIRRGIGIGCGIRRGIGRGRVEFRGEKPPPRVRAAASRLPPWPRPRPRRGSLD